MRTERGRGPIECEDCMAQQGMGQSGTVASPEFSPNLPLRRLTSGRGSWGSTLSPLQGGLCLQSARRRMGGHTAHSYSCSRPCSRPCSCSPLSHRRQSRSRSKKPKPWRARPLVLRRGSERLSHYAYASSQTSLRRRGGCAAVPILVPILVVVLVGNRRTFDKDCDKDHDKDPNTVNLSAMYAP